MGETPRSVLHAVGATDPVALWERKPRTDTARTKGPARAKLDPDSCRTEEPNDASDPLTPGYYTTSRNLTVAGAFGSGARDGGT
jgi:hypothetical protein